ncbi:MAG TPA: hypothetical protein VLK85_16640 [Ramlibacter sp.]|nr:hypothetical protein [Ramlibacter sp.]
MLAFLINLLAVAAAAVAGLLACVMLLIGVMNESARDGGRLLGTLMFGLPFGISLLVAHAIGLQRGGFDWVAGPPGESSGLRWALVLLVVGVVWVVNTLSVAAGSQSAHELPRALAVLSPWVWALCTPALLASALLGLWPAWHAGWSPWAWRVPLAAVAALSVLAGAAALVEMAVESVTRAAALEKQAVIDRAAEREKSLDELRQLDPVKDLGRLLVASTAARPEAQRAVALQKIATLVQPTQAVAEVLRGPWPQQAMTYLADNDPPDPAALAEPLRQGILQQAEELRIAVRDAHTLRPDDYLFDVYRILASAERLAPHGVDYRPAVRAVRVAFDEKRRQPVDFEARRLLDRWLAAQDAAAPGKLPS